jgi:hypothetical protein
MTWFRIDDDMLNHEKWRRAIRAGGGTVVEVWLRLSLWCSKRLTDGLVPADMVDELAELGRSKSKARALQALVDAKLLAWFAPGECSFGVRQGLVECAPRARQAHDALAVVNYLVRNPSKSRVLANRDRRAQGQHNRRHTDDVTGFIATTDDDVKPMRNDVPSRPVPSRPNPPVVVPHAGPSQGEPTLYTTLDGWDASELEDEALSVGVSREYYRERIRRVRNTRIGGRNGVRDRAEWVREQLGRWRTWEESERAQKMGATRKGSDAVSAQADRINMLRAQEAAEESRKAAP